MNVRGLTYFFLIIILACAGTVVSGPVAGGKYNCKAGSVLQKDSNPVLLDAETAGQSDQDNREKCLVGYQSALKKENNRYIPINYLLSEQFIGNDNNSGRTSIWFTSRIKN
ncbi:MAG: hypothetical protein WC061_03165 [Melioribacteraceae bacterium]